MHAVIIGGGFTGAVAALQLSRRVRQPTTITVVEPRAELGCGVAYSTRDPAHRINVPTSRMTVLEEDATGFETWLAGLGDLGDPVLRWTDGSAFPQRQLFGRYVGALVREAADQATCATIRHEVAYATAVQARRDGFDVSLGGGGMLRADVVILAVSHPPPAVPTALRKLAEAGAPVIADSWAPGALSRIHPDAAVMIVGMGLTMADVAASLERGGHRGPIHAISRRGLMSRGHAFGAVPKAEYFGANPPPASARALCRAIRQRITAEQARGVPWQAVLDDVRANARRLWTALGEREQRRLVRHLRPFWDVHRFRVSPQAETAIARLRAAGRFTSQAASLIDATWDGSAFAVRVHPRFSPRGSAQTVQADVLVVTTGPDHAHAIRSNPALASLAAQGLIAADRVGLGLAVDEASRAIGADGTACPRLLVAGPLARGRFGELMGLPQVSDHARDVAATAAAFLNDVTPAPRECADTAAAAAPL